MTDDAILDRLIAREGGFVNHPSDRGRATKYGITLVTLGDFRGRPVTVDDVRQLTETEAREIYLARYLGPFSHVPADVKEQVVDIAVNSGVTTARALYGLATAQTDRPVGVQLTIERLKHYARICKADPTQTVFLAGWVNRTCSFL